MQDGKPVYSEKLGIVKDLGLTPGQIGDLDRVAQAGQHEYAGLGQRLDATPHVGCGHEDRHVGVE